MKKGLIILANLICIPLIRTQIGALCFLISIMVGILFPLTVLIQLNPLIALAGLQAMLFLLGIGYILGLTDFLICNYSEIQRVISSEFTSTISSVTQIFTPTKLMRAAQPPQEESPIEMLPIEIIAPIIDNALSSSPLASNFHLSLVDKNWFGIFNLVLASKRCNVMENIFPFANRTLLEKNQSEEIEYLLDHETLIIEKACESDGLILQRAFKRIKEIPLGNSDRNFFATESVLDLINKNILSQHMKKKDFETYIGGFRLPTPTDRIKLDVAGIHIKLYSQNPPFINYEITGSRKLICSKNYLTRWPVGMLDESEEIREFFNSVESIDLSDNFLRGLPIAFNELTELKHLCVTGNQLTEIAPPLWTKLCTSEGTSISIEEVLEKQSTKRSSNTI